VLKSQKTRPKFFQDFQSSNQHGTVVKSPFLKKTCVLWERLPVRRDVYDSWLFMCMCTPHESNMGDIGWASSLCQLSARNHSSAIEMQERLTRIYPFKTWKLRWPVPRISKIQSTQRSLVSSLDSFFMQISVCAHHSASSACTWQMEHLTFSM
jgi:hypothetical protein